MKELFDRIHKFKLQDEVQDGERYPKFYGYSYYDFDKCAKIAYPIPINFIVAWIRELRHYCLLHLLPRKSIQEHIRIYQHGYDKGFQKGKEYGGGDVYRKFIESRF